MPSRSIFIERVWLITAACCALVALVFLLIGKFDGAFVAGAIGVLAWFLDVRGRLRKDAGLVENTKDADGD